MDHFSRIGGVLHAEKVALHDIAERFGTPTYVYSRATLERHWRAFDQAMGNLPHLVCYAVKANSSLAVLDVLARLGSGFDIVSLGELERVLAAGGDAGKVVFSGVGKRVDEIEQALEVGIRCFNVESGPELQRINEIAHGIGTTAPVSIRVNPDVDANTHPYIATGLKTSKFGVDIPRAMDLYREAAGMPGIRIEGLDCHIGSQLTDVSPFVDALNRVLELADRLVDSGIEIRHLDLGGGLGIRYQNETPPEPEAYARAILACLDGRDYEILLEPGRAISGNAGVLLTRVEYIKQGEAKNFAVVDAAMSDLVRPSLYDAWHGIETVDDNETNTAVYDVVGPVCESGDFLGKDRELAIVPGSLLCIRSAGAYGFTMASNYNSRPMPCEVMVQGDQAYLVRERQVVGQLFAGERCLPGD